MSQHAQHPPHAQGAKHAQYMNVLEMLNTCIIPVFTSLCGMSKLFCSAFVRRARLDCWSLNCAPCSVIRSRDFYFIFTLSYSSVSCYVQGHLGHPLSSRPRSVTTLSVVLHCNRHSMQPSPHSIRWSARSLPVQGVSNLYHPFTLRSLQTFVMHHRPPFAGESLAHFSD